MRVAREFPSKTKLNMPVFCDLVANAATIAESFCFTLKNSINFKQVE